MVSQRSQRPRRQAASTNTANTNSTGGVTAASQGANTNTHNQPASLGNSQQSREMQDPLDFETLPLDALRRCRRGYGLTTPAPETFDGYLLRGGVKKQTWSAVNLRRSTKAEAAASVKQHFMRENIRETETIVEFLYAVRNKDRVFKIQF